MSDEPELFAESEMAALSPRLQWMHRHGVGTREHTNGESPSRWEAWIGNYADSLFSATMSDIDMDYASMFVWADSEMEALEELAKRNGWKLWNEEVAQ